MPFVHDIFEHVLYIRTDALKELTNRGITYMLEMAETHQTINQRGHFIIWFSCHLQLTHVRKQSVAC